MCSNYEFQQHFNTVITLQKLQIPATPATLTPVITGATVILCCKPALTWGNYEPLLNENMEKKPAEILLKGFLLFFLPLFFKCEVSY